MERHILALFVLQCLLSTTFGGLPPTVTVTTPLGEITGHKASIGPQTANECHSFRGIQFAEPSSYTGTSRWNRASMKKAWTGSIDATEWAPACPQDCVEEPLTCPTTFDELCLHLNVWVPPTATPSSKLPVSIFIHGGNYRRESAGNLLYWGGGMCNSTGTIVVTIDYRLGAFGFFALPGDSTVDPNLGIDDQRLAMKWVQMNIGSFGGNPEDVTVYGQSAGAGSVLIHYVTPHLTKGLFKAVLSQSNPAAIEYKNVGETDKFGTKLAKEAECDKSSAAETLECLRNVNWVKVLAAQMATAKAEGLIPYPQIFEHAYPYSPVVGTADIPKQPLTMAAEGTVSPDVSYMAGFDQDDALQFVWGFFPKPVPYLEYEIILTAVFGAKNFEAIKKQYPVPDSHKNDTRFIMNHLVTDYAFGCANRYIIQKIAPKVNKGVYMYNYTHALSFNGWGKRYIECLHHVCHGSEIPILFNSAQIAGFKPDQAEFGLAIWMQNVWAKEFMRDSMTGAPITSQGAPSWPPAPKTFPAKTPVYVINSASNLHVDTTTLNEKCILWDKIGYLKA